MQVIILLVVLLVGYNTVAHAKPHRGYLKFDEHIETVEQPLSGMCPQLCPIKFSSYN